MPEFWPLLHLTDIVQRNYKMCHLVGGIKVSHASHCSDVPLKHIHALL